jgi:hypothetical protein
MKELSLPVIKGALPAAKRLSMEDYIKFINLHLKYTLDRKTIRRQKRLAAVNVHFSLK